MIHHEENPKTMANPKFQFYEIVRVASSDLELTEIQGEIGAVLGMSEHENKDGKFNYGVHIYRDEICWDIPEDDLEATGVFSCREEFYDDTSIRVRVDEQGRGWLVD